MTEDKAARLAAIRANNKTPLPETSQANPDSAITFPAVVLVVCTSALGALAAAVVVPSAFPALLASLLGPNPKVFWYLSRSSALAAYMLVWLSMVFGLLITNKLGRIWPGGPTAFALHQHTSLLGIAFAVFHALILLGDHYIHYTIVQIAVPFASVAYQQIWVGLGQVALYVHEIARQVGQHHAGEGQALCPGPPLRYSSTGFSVL